MELIRAALADRDENGPTRLAIFRGHAVLLDVELLNRIHRRRNRGPPEHWCGDCAAIQHTVIRSRSAAAYPKIAVITAAVTACLLRYARGQREQAINIATRGTGGRQLLQLPLVYRLA